MMVGPSFRDGREAFYALADERWEFACAHRTV